MSPSARSEPTRPVTLAAVLSAFFLLVGCGYNVGTIARVDPAEALDPHEGIVVGRVMFVVDGATMNYNALNKPSMRLANYSDDQFYETPQVGKSGSFSWRIPAGSYEVAVLFGGLAELTGFVPPGGGAQQVLGLPRPGYGFVVKPGHVHYLGTLVVDVESREPEGVLPNFTGERAFGRLNKTYVVNAESNAPEWRPYKDRPEAEVSLFIKRPSAE
jgi:hypothetical protein